MRTPLYFFSIFLLISCTVGQKSDQTSTECERYFNLIRKDWNNYGDYYGFSQQPDYLREPQLQKIFFQYLCLVNLSRKKLKRLLGKYNQELDLGNRTRISYCLSANCDRRWDFHLDSLGYVREIYLNPLVIDSN